MRTCVRDPFVYTQSKCTCLRVFVGLVLRAVSGPEWVLWIEVHSGFDKVTNNRGKNLDLKPFFLAKSRNSWELELRLVRRLGWAQIRL